MSRPRVVLVKPPDVSEFNFGAFSLGTLAAYICDVSDPIIIDATDSHPSEAAQRVWSLEPDMVGITIMGLASMPSGLRFLELLRCNRGAAATPIFVGGHGATAAPMLFLEADATAVVLGEGELTLRSILEFGFERGAAGTMCLVDGELVSGAPQRLIRPLDQLPFPARNLMPLPPDGVHLMETSRGCPHRCAFCETSRFHQGQWRPFSPERVAAEAVQLVEDYDAWTILFADDNFAASPNRVLQICDRLRRGPLPATFLAAVRADDLLRKPEIIPAMARARILRVNVGVETLEPDAAAAVGKPISRQVYREAFDCLRAHGIFSVASFIVGLPGQKADGAYALADLAVDSGPDAAIFVPFIPMPGTPLAAGRASFEVSDDDRQNAVAATTAFFRHPAVRRRLAEAEEAGGIRGLMAGATISHHLTENQLGIRPLVG